MASSDDTTTVILIVFVSFGGLLFVGCIAVLALCWFCEKKHKKKEEKVDEIVRVDEHLKVKEALVEGHHGPEAVVLEFVDDVHVEGGVMKEEKIGKSPHSNPLEIAQSSNNHSKS